MVRTFNELQNIEYLLEKGRRRNRAILDMSKALPRKAKKRARAWMEYNWYYYIDFVYNTLYPIG